MNKEGNWVWTKPDEVLRFSRAEDRSFLVQNRDGQFFWLPRNNARLNRMFPNCNKQKGSPNDWAQDLGNLADSLGRRVRRNYDCGFFGIAACNQNNLEAFGVGEPISPISGSCRISSEKGYRWGRHHDGCDIAVPTGTDLKAPMDGMILGSGPNGGYGNAQEMLWFPKGFNKLTFMDAIQGMNRLEVLEYLRDNPIVTTIDGKQYTNLRSYSAHLLNYQGRKAGDFVEKGQPIAQTNNTGSSTGPHLHFEVHSDNPLPGCWNDKGIDKQPQVYKCDPRGIIDICGKGLK